MDKDIYEQTIPLVLKWIDLAVERLMEETAGMRDEGTYCFYCGTKKMDKEFFIVEHEPGCPIRLLKEAQNQLIWESIKAEDGDMEWKLI